MRVPDIGMDVPAMDAGFASMCRCSERDILNTLLDAVELATIAGGCRRVVVSPPRVSLAFLERRGYVRVNERCAGGWIEKTTRVARRSRTRSQGEPLRTPAR